MVKNFTKTFSAHVEYSNFRLWLQDYDLRWMKIEKGTDPSKAVV